MMIRYYLTENGELDPVEEPGRCDRFWELWTRRAAVQLELGQRPDEPRPSILLDQLETAEIAVSAHLEVCQICQAWITRCEQISETGIAIPA